MTDRNRFLRAIYRQNLSSFVERVFRTLEPGRAYQHNWHIDHIAWQLSRVARGEIKRLIAHPAAAPTFPCPAICPATPPATAPFMHPLASTALADVNVIAAKQIAATTGLMSVLQLENSIVNSRILTEFRAPL